MMTKAMMTFATAALLFAGAAKADIRHIVMFKYQPEVAASTKAEIAKRFIGLKDLAKREGKPYIVSIVAGRAISKEGFDQGFEDAFIVTFKTKSDRDYFVGRPYQEEMDPDHQALAKIAEPLLLRDAQGKDVGLFAFDFDDEARR
jgi:Stress responsive A/B Barrel Domain